MRRHPAEGCAVMTAKLVNDSRVFTVRSGGGYRILVMWKCIGAFLFLLASLQFAHGYSTVSLGRLCSKRGGSLSLVSSSATSVVLDSFNHSSLPCRVEVSAPATHHISMLFTPRRRAVERLQAGAPRLQKSCPLTVSHPGSRVDQYTKTVDLCSPSALEDIKYTELLPPVVVLEWHPQLGVKGEEVLALEMVFAAVGRGQEICSHPDMFPCIARPHYAIYCIGAELVCDGRRNCPYSGNDEDQMLCDAEDNIDRLSPGKSPPQQQNENFRFGQGLQFLASEMLKKFIVSKNNNKQSDTMGSSTEKSTVLWFDDDSGKHHSENLPNVLNHYGPWGYLMLGMLICGTVLMFCGLWECCCRRPKTPPANHQGPTLLIINQGAQGAEGLEVPVTPGPPRYEDLDQPPSYTTLFPTLKPNSGPPSDPPVAVPSSSHSSVEPRVGIFTIDCPTPDTRPKLEQ